jgi:N-acetylglucosaminyl-diphospho-decaprenol L-rhamnosyltransferase
MMRVSACVVTYHTGPRLHECLYGLDADPQVDEIIIADNGNPPGETGWIARFAASRPKVKLAQTGGNIGFGAAANIAAQTASGEALLFINPDAVIRWNSVEPMLEAEKGQPPPCIVGGKIFGPCGREERGGRRKTLTLARALGLAKWTLEDEPAPEGPIEVGAISGAFFLVRRQVFLDLGGFDESYFLHFEDLDLCRRGLAAGGTVIYQPRAAALHYGSTSDVSSAAVQAHKADSLKRYFRKFSRGPIERALLIVLLPVMAWRLRRKG